MTDKREKIVDAAIALFLADGFWKTTTANISKKAGVATGTLFNIFATKEILIDEVYASLKSEVHHAVFEQLPETADTRLFLQVAWNSYIKWALDNPDRQQIMEQLRLSELVSTATKNAMADQFGTFFQRMDQALKKDEISDLPLELHMQLMAAQANAVISYLHKSAIASSERERLILTAFDVYWRGIHQPD